MRPAPEQLQDLDPNEPVTLGSLIRTVISNYGTYFETKAQLTSLQEWVKTQEKIYNEKQ